MWAEGKFQYEVNSIVFDSHGSDLTIIDSEIFDISTPFSSPIIYIEHESQDSKKTLTLTNSVFRNNSAIMNSGVFTSKNTDININQSIFSNNVAH